MNENGWCGVVLAGGRSSRMGRDKALIEHNGRSLIANAVEILRPHVDELLIIGDPSTYGRIGPLVIADDTSGQGPLGGILTALRYAWNDRSIVLACDMPNINARFIEHLKTWADRDHDAVVAQCDGRMEPLAAVYHRSCRHVFSARLAAGERKMSTALDRVRTRYLQVCPGEEEWPDDLFRNINTPTDL
ncbi:MAG: molybdenum cofactor guanylyltransferase [Flavobacteriales bacterium]|nr:molybdenum cofactor guanylyltransferase [Flavobacteriales bacterium]